MRRDVRILLVGDGEFFIAQSIPFLTHRINQRASERAP